MVAGERLLPHVMRLGEALFHVAEVLLDVSIDVVLVALVKPRGAVLERRGRIEDGGQLFVFNLDQR